MLKPITLDQAEFKSALASSLYETILEKAAAECSDTLLNLISIACDFNHEIHRALIAELGMGGAKPFEVLMHAESALNASKEAMAVLELWLESIPSDAPNSDACLVSAIMSLLHSGIKELVKAREAYSNK